MKAVILDAFAPQEAADILKPLTAMLENRGWKHKVFRLEQMEIKPCASCGSCAADTPGLCTIKDDMEKIYTEWANCQLVVFCSPVSFGGYHSRLKMAQDRFMPMNMAYFCVRQGELHHQNRYDPTPALMTVGFLPEENAREQQAFEYLTERNAINMNISDWAAVVFTGQDTPEDVFRRLESALKEVIPA